MPRLGLDPDDPKVEAAVFAELIEDFWRSDIGKYLMARAKEESEEAMKHLIEGAHGMTQKQIVAAQAQVWRASKFCEWLEEAYKQGVAALRLLEEESDANRPA